jgi:two-component system, LuxR family, sensor kinase FixL
MRVFEVMNRNVETVRPTVHASEAKTRMRQKKIHHLVVMQGSALAGVVSERDLGGPKLPKVLGKWTVEDLMSTPVVTVTSRTPVRRAAALMKGRSIGSLVVTSANGKLAGIVTVSDLLSLLARRPDPDAPRERRRETNSAPGRRRPVEAVDLRSVSEPSAQPADDHARVAEARWRAIIDAAVDGIIVIDARGTIEAFNAAAERMFGYAEREVLGQNVRLLMPEPYRSQHDGYLNHHLATGEKKVIGIGRAVNALRRDGQVFPVHLSVGAFEIDGEKHFTGILHDLSRRTELEERLREATALARLGEMAAVIAHEVKNPLAAVRGAVQVIGSRISTQTNDGAIIKEIIARLDALNDLIQDLLVFARPPAPKLAVVDLHSLVESIATLLKRDPAFQSLEIRISGHAAAAHADPNLVTIAIQNLLINAAQAQQGRGEVRVTLASAGPSSRIEIADSGPGIPEEIRAALFRPFKTTKARGTGLGMATAKRLIESQGGHIEVQCPPSGGTVVTLLVPAAPAEH